MYDTPDTVGDVPNKPKTRADSFRLGDDLMIPAKELAKARGVTATDIVKEALEEYLSRAGVLDRDAERD